MTGLGAVRRRMLVWIVGGMAWTGSAWADDPTTTVDPTKSPPAESAPQEQAPVVESGKQLPMPKATVVEELTAEQKAWIEEKNKYLAEIEKRRGKNAAQMVPVGERILIQDRETFGSVHAETARTLDVLALTYYMASKFDLAASARAEIKQINLQLYGKDDWRSMEANWQHQMYMHMMKSKQYRDLSPKGYEILEKARVHFRNTKYAEAWKTAQQAYDTFKSVYGEDCPPCAETLGLMGLIRSDERKMDEAEKLMHQSAGVYKGWYSEMSPQYAWQIYQLAHVMLLRSDNVQAEALYRQSIGIYNQVEGYNKSDYAIVLARLGGFYSRSGQAARAEEYLLKALELEKEVNGDKSRNYLDAQLSLVDVYRQLSRYSECNDLLKSVDATIGANKWRQSLIGALAKSYEGLVRDSQNQTEQAVAAYRDAREIERALFGGKDSFNTAIYLMSIGRILLKGDWKTNGPEAEQAYLDAIGVFKETVGLKHPDALDTRSRLNSYRVWLASDLMKDGKPSEARAKLEENVELARQFFPETHEAVKEAQAELAYQEMLEQASEEDRKLLLEADQLQRDAYDAYNKYAYPEAIQHFRRALELRTGRLPEGQHRLAQNHLGLARAYLGSKQYPEAEAEYRLAEPGFAPSISQKRQYFPLDYASVLKDLGDVCKALGKTGDALGYWNRALDIYREETPNSWDYMKLALKIGETYQGQSDYGRAELIFRDRGERLAQVYGRNHFQFAQNTRWVGEVLFAAGKFTEAREQLQLSREIMAALNLTDSAFDIGVQIDLALVEEKAGSIDAATKAMEVALEKARQGKSKEDLEWVMSRYQQLLVRRSMIDEAEPLAKERVELAREAYGPGSSGLSDAERDLEDVYIYKTNNLRNAKKYAEAHEVYKVLIEQRIRRYGADHWATVDSETWSALCAQLAGLDAKKLAQYEEAAQQRVEAGQLSSKGKYQEAVDLATKASETIRGILGDTNVMYASSLADIATFANSLNKTELHQELARKTIDIRKKAFRGGVNPTIAEMELTLAYSLILEGKYKDALEVLKEAADIYANTNHRYYYTYGRTMTLTGNAQLRLADYAAARKSLDEAESLLVRYQNDQAYYWLENVRLQAELANDLDDLSESERLSRVAFDLTLRNYGENSIDHGRSMHDLGRILSNRGQYDEAEKLLRKALEIRRKIFTDESVVYASTQFELATVYYRKPDYDLAEPLYKSAAETFGNAWGKQNASYLSTQSMLASLYTLRGQLKRAEPILREVIAGRAQVLGKNNIYYNDSVSSMVRLLICKGAATEAAPFATESLEFSERHLDSAAGFQTDRQRQQSIQSLRHALDRYLTIVEPGELDPAKAYSHVLRWKGALFTRQRKLRELRGVANADMIFERWGHVTGSLATLSLRVPYPEERPIWQSRIASLSDEKDQLEQQLLSMAKETKSAAPPTAEQIQKLLTPKTAVVDFLEYYHLQPDENLQPTSARKVAVFVVRPDQPVKMVVLGDPRTMSPLIDEWRAAATGGTFNEQKPRDFLTVSNELKAALWQPIEPLLEGIETVLMVPDGAIGKLPFAALPGKEDGTYLIEERSFGVLPVPSLMPELLARAAQPMESQLQESLLLVGNIDYGVSPSLARAEQSARLATNTRSWLPYQFSELEGFLTEIKDIRGYFSERYRNGEAMLLERKRANELSFRREAPKHRWIHVATHGFFAPDVIKTAYEAGPQSRTGTSTALATNEDMSQIHEGLMSGLALAGANEINSEGSDDGILSALEVATLDLSQVEMAVLSACETGLGSTVSGEGVVGLQRAFQVAGARTTVTSLWPVDDLGTQLLMSRFYRNLWNRREPRTRIEALSEAQRWFLQAARASGGVKLDTSELDSKSEKLPEQFQLPSYWAAFMLSGDWR
jgi:CHAT domain-containing protein/tetratricopeptide (TPR) repeat protein